MERRTKFGYVETRFFDSVDLPEPVYIVLVRRIL